MREGKDKMDIRSFHGTYTADFVKEINYREIVEKGDIAIIDKLVFELHSEVLAPFFNDDNAIFINATEEQKSYQGVEKIIDSLIERGFHKSNKLIAIGGGITQDVTAFISSILYRGTNWVLIPTTLLAQCDSCIGSKTSINFGKYKNQVGNFYPPRQIWINPNFLKTLPEKEIKSGLGEMLHYFVVGGNEDIKFYADRYQTAPGNPDQMIELIMRSLEIKKSYVEIDEFDKKERQIFNYGHSFGHAIESISTYNIPHGIAVSYGMDMANYISCKMGILDENVRKEVREIVVNYWNDNDIKVVTAKGILEGLSKDKKNAGKKLGIILCEGYGKLHKEMIEPTDEFVGWIEEYVEKEILKGDN